MSQYVNVYIYSETFFNFSIVESIKHWLYFALISHFREIVILGYEIRAFYIKCIVSSTHAQTNFSKLVSQFPAQWESSKNTSIYIK